MNEEEKNSQTTEQEKTESADTSIGGGDPKSEKQSDSSVKEVMKEEYLKFIAIQTEYSKDTRKISFYCMAFDVTRQVFYDYPARKKQTMEIQNTCRINDENS